MRAALLCAIAAAGLALGGCSIKGGNPNVIVGKQLFVQKCGSCHTLARAGTKGTVGPNLDAAFAQSKADGFGDDAIQGLVRKQIQFPSRAGDAGNGVMPAHLVNSNRANDIAAYVAMVVSAKGKDTGLLATAVQSNVSTKPAVEKGGVVTIPADPSGQLQYVYKTATAKAGKVTIEMPNMSGTPHNIAIQGVGNGQITPKGVSKFSANLKPGTYTYFCQVPGHEAAGMKGTLTVK